jgi:hypothetical protein
VRNTTTSLAAATVSSVTTPLSKAATKLSTRVKNSSVRTSRTASSKSVFDTESTKSLVASSATSADSAAAA